jgi:hypothetical protein
MKTDRMKTQLGGRLNSAQDCLEVLRNGMCIRCVGSGEKAEVKNNVALRGTESIRLKTSALDKTTIATGPAVPK